MEIQETRRDILDILKQQQECTVEDIVAALEAKQGKSITTVTVRHHLERLRAENLVKAPEIRRRSSPGRPQHVYKLDEKAYEYFPNNYAGFADGLLNQMKAHLPTGEVNVILEDMASDMAARAGIPRGASIAMRLGRTVDYLNKQGYAAQFRETDGGFLLVTCNCPYERIAETHSELCTFDLRLVSALLGVVPRFVGSQREGDSNCQYFIPA